MMKKIVLKTFACAAALTVVLVMMMALSQVEANAATWYFNDAHNNRLNEGKLTEVSWGTEVDQACVS